MAQSEILVVLAKKPVPSRTKTRLSPPLKAREAADLYACFLADTLAEARMVDGVDHLLAYDPPQARHYFAELAPDYQLLPQKGANLGERMHQTFATLLSCGYHRMVLIGSDLPHILAYNYQQGFEALREEADIVLGPCLDGGYYLIGLTRPAPYLFKLQMSTPNVLRQTIEHVERLGLSLALLQENFDVDTISDLINLGKLLNDKPAIQASRTRAWMEAHSFLTDDKK